MPYRFIQETTTFVGQPARVVAFGETVSDAEFAELTAPNPTELGAMFEKVEPIKPAKNGNQATD